MNRTPLQESAVRIYERLVTARDAIRVELTRAEDPMVVRSLRYSVTMLDRVISEISSLRLEADK